MLYPISNHFDCLGQVLGSEEAWQLFKDSILLSAKSTIGHLKPRKKSWILQKTQHIIEQCHKARLAKDMVTYRHLNSIRNKFLYRDRKLFTQKKAADLKEAARKGDKCTLYKHL